MYCKMLIIWRFTFSQDEIAAARPDIDERTEQLVSNGKWMPPGYKVCGGGLCFPDRHFSAP